MTAFNYIYPFASDPTALVLTDGDYAVDAQRLIGHQPGIARAELENKALRQSSLIASVVGQFITDYAEEDVYDSDSPTLVLTNFVTALQKIAGFPAGTKMVFYQAAAPPTWTKITTYDDMALRVVSGTGGGIGGTHGLSTPPTTNHFHYMPNHVHTTAGHVLSIAEMPSHSHPIPYAQLAGGSGTIADITGGGYSQPGIAIGGGGSHSHGDTGVGGAGNTNDKAPTAFAPKYIDCIICTKD